MSDGERVAIILAAVGCGPEATASRAGFRREVAGRGEVFEIEPSPGSTLVPELWRDGLRRVPSTATVVAFSTTEMIPQSGWLDDLLVGLIGHDGVGGGIAPGDQLGPGDRAIYLQRFLPYGPGADLPDRPSGENAAYRWDRLEHREEAWRGGFWEVEIHHALERSGATWGKSPGAILTYAGSSGLRPAIGPRIAHGRRHGANRSAGWSFAERWVRWMTTPAVPALLAWRAWRGLRRRGMTSRPWLAAWPSFLIVAGAWSFGEGWGVGSSLQAVRWPIPSARGSRVIVE